MGWLISLLILASFNYILTSPTTLSEQLPFANQLQDINDMTDNYPLGLEEDLVLRKIGKNLAQILVHDWPSNDLPIIYVENSEPEETQDVDYQQLANNEEETQFSPVPLKRTRYYRKYPWKRQNSRYPYDAENRYMCQPSKDDVFRLLVALHEARQGNRGHTINFCNRKRPAASVFTNIRFLGRRK